jgi:hypothetical protein
MTEDDQVEGTDQFWKMIHDTPSQSSLQGQA